MKNIKRSTKSTKKIKSTKRTRKINLTDSPKTMDNNQMNLTPSNRKTMTKMKLDNSREETKEKM